MVRFADKTCSRRCQWRLTFAELPRAWWAQGCASAALCAVCPQVCFINRCQIIAAVPMTQSVFGPVHGGSLWFSHTSAADAAVCIPHRSRRIMLWSRGTSRRPVVVLCQLFENNNNPHPGRPENKVQSQEWESGAPIYWCQLKLAANFLASRLCPEALSEMH